MTREGKRAEEQLVTLLGEATSESNKRAVEKMQRQVQDALVPLRKEAMKALGL